MSRAGLYALCAVMTGAAPVAAQPADPRLDAFRDACVPGVRSFEKTEAAVAAAGWSEVAEDADPELAAVMKVGREMADYDDEVRLSGQSIYARAIDGATYYIVTHYVTSEWGNYVSCHFYDFASERLIDPTLISGWLGEGPVTARNDPATVIAQEWENPRKLPAVKVAQTAVLAGSSVSEMVRFTGVSLLISASEQE